ncbi:MAG: EAL domain-containing protein [Geminicoccaceae bacterium]
MRLRIALAILALGTLLVGGVLFVTLRHSLETTRATVAIADHETTALLSEMSRLALLAGEFEQVQAFIDALDKHSRLRDVVVLDAASRVRAATAPRQISDGSDGGWPGQPGWIASEIVSGGQRLGWLQARFSDDDVLAANREAYRIGIALAAAGMLALALFGWTAGHLLTRRLSRLAAVADEVSAGDLHSRARLVGQDETARVGRAFDGMIDRIADSLEQIKRDRDRLILPTESITEAFALWDGEERLVRYNRRFAEFLGNAAAPIDPHMRYEAFLTGPFRGAVADTDEPWDARIARILRQHRQGIACNPEFALRDSRWLRASKSHLPDGSVLTIYADITEIKTRELALRDGERRLRAIMDAVVEGIMVVDACGTIRDANPSAAALFGYPADWLSQVRLDDLLNGEIDLATSRLRREVEGKRRDGTRFAAEVTVGALGAGGATSIVTVRDVTTQKADRDQILRQATHDELTGLPNRRLFDDRLEMTLRHAARSGEFVALAFLDIDRFKAVNDSLGHGAGDRLLQTLSRRLQRSLRNSDTVARMGGDEFIFILPGLQSQEDAAALAQKLVEIVREPVRLGERELLVTASIGVAVYPIAGGDRDALLRHADAALYRAKASGRDRVELFDHEAAAQTEGRTRLGRDLRRALGRNQLALVYQPQVSLRSGRIVGIEALMRWHHPRLGLVPPATFIPMAEESGLITTLELWALRQACRDMVTLEGSSAAAARLAVNLSARQLRQDRLVAMVERTLAESGLPAQRLELEVTETALLPSDGKVAATLAALRSLGVSLALADFGVASSSLSLLRQYPIQRLKMDRAFVRDITSDRANVAVARATIDLARELGIVVLAVGVETAEQLAILRDLGCEEAQGFLIGRPLPAREVVGVLRKAA